MSYLPLSTKTIKVIKATAPVVAPRATAITSNFYPRLFKNHPEVSTFFNKAHQVNGTQPQALADAVVAYASHIDKLEAVGGAVAKINHRHCALGVTPPFYPAVHESLLASIAEVLGDTVTPEIGEAWSNAVMALGEICIGEEEKLYQLVEQREGGWRGYKEFTLIKKTQVGIDTVAFDFQACDNPDAKIDFSPGQYLSIRCDAASPTPRHYTVTSKPGENILQCTTRHVKAIGGKPEGAMSGYMHTQMKEGDVVKLAPPFGLFTKDVVLGGAGGKDTTNDNINDDVVFITAGIGITLARSLSTNVNCIGMIHVDKSVDHTGALVEGIEKDADISVQGLYGLSRSDVRDTIHGITEANPKNVHYALCGPLGFMRSAKEALETGGAKNVHYELFGTGSM